MDRDHAAQRVTGTSLAGRSPLIGDGSGKLAYIDALRGIAVLMVISVHHLMHFRDVPYLPSLVEFGQTGVLDWPPFAGLPVIVTYVASWFAAVALTFLAARVAKQLIEDPGIALGKRLIGQMKAQAARAA